MSEEDGRPTNLKPFCSTEEFDQLALNLAHSEAPSRFAVLQVLGDNADGRIAAWGLGYPDGEASIATGSGSWLSLSAPEHALPHFTSPLRNITARLVWVDPQPVPSPPEYDTEV